MKLASQSLFSLLLCVGLCACSSTTTPIAPDATATIDLGPSPEDTPSPTDAGTADSDTEPDDDAATNLDAQVDASLPDVQVDASLPDVQVDAQLPDVEVDAQLPDVEVDASLPDVEVDASLPDVEVDASLPDVEVDIPTDVLVDVPSPPDVLVDVVPEDIDWDAESDEGADEGATDDAGEEDAEPETQEEDNNVPPADEQPPTWPANAKLEALDVGPDALTLSWPLASDNVGVGAYVVHRDGELEAELAGDATSLVVSNLEEATAYDFTLHALDEAQNSSEELAVTAETTDVTAPTWSVDAGLVATEIKDDEVTLSWTVAVDAQGVATYEVRLGEETVATTEGATNAQVAGLAPWQAYTFQIFATDGSGNTSAPGPSLTLKTTDSVAPAWPDGATLEALEIAPESVTLGWTEATDEVGVASYELWLDGAFLKSTDGATHAATVEGLEPGKTYIFQLWALDEAGNVSAPGPSAVLQTTDQAPPSWPAEASLVASSVEPTSLTLTWTPAVDDVAVTLYRVWQDGEEVATTASAQVDLLGLAPFTTYEFTVLAEDGAGNVSQPGPSVVVFTPDEEAPSWPLGAALEISDLTPYGLTLSWMAAQDDVGVVTYRIAQDGAPLIELDGAITTLAVEELSPWTVVEFEVRAVDGAGNVSSPALSASVQTPDEEPPAWVDGVATATDITPTTLTLSWTEATDDVEVSAYKVLLGAEVLVEVAGDVTSLEVTELTPWTEVEFKVEAGDPAGHWTLDGPSVIAKTTDEEGPAWPEDAALVASGVSPTGLLLAWPEATDDVGVTSYEIKADGGTVETVSGDVTQIALTSLIPGKTYLLEAVASDEAGNLSLPLKVTVTTLDGGAPTWPPGAELVAVALSTQVSLSWPEATDDVGVTAYRVFMDGVQVVETAELLAVVKPVEPDTEVAFSVEAVDGAGNASEDGPSTTVITPQDYDPGFRRPTMEQFNRSLADLHGETWAAAWAKGNFDEAWYRDSETFYALFTAGEGYWLEYRSAYPPDLPVAALGEPRGGYRRLDQTVYDEHLSSWVGAVMWVAENEYEKGPGKNVLFDTCLADNAAGVTDFATDEEVYENCVANFVTDFGSRAFKRPLSADEHAFFMTIYGQVGEKYVDENLEGMALAARGLRNVVAAITLSPEFIYRVELGDENQQLSAYELAARLAYHFWNTLPDQELLADAADGSLLTDEIYAYHVDRLFNDSRAQRAIKEFYRDFFRVHEIPDLKHQDGPTGYHITPPDYFNTDGAFGYIVRAMAEELSNLGIWYTHTNPGTYEGLFRSNLHLLECQKGYWDPVCLGGGPWSFYSYQIEGVCDSLEECTAMSWADTGHAWDGVSPPVELPEAERVGLLTRLGMLSHDTYLARPIRRGLAIREMLLCEKLPPPEDCSVVKPPEVNGDNQVLMTAREKVEAITEQPGTSCAGCHATLINPFGHALGHFSSMGQYWEKEHMFTLDKDADGNLLYNLAPPQEWAEIDTSGTSFIDGQMVSFEGAQELADLLVDSGKMEWCWSREYFRFATGRTEWKADAETIETIADLLRSGGSLAEAFKAIAYTAQFKALHKGAQDVNP